jgi:hypothetical protein
MRVASTPCVGYAERATRINFTLANAAKDGTRHIQTRTRPLHSLSLFSALHVSLFNLECSSLENMRGLVVEIKKAPVIDLTNLPRDVWDLMLRFLPLKDLKTLSHVNQALAHRMRVLMRSNFRFRVLRSLADFRALGWTRECRNIRLTTMESVFELLEDDVYVDIELPFGFNTPPDKVSWPSDVTHLTFSRDFDHPVDRLPSSLTRLVLRGDFNQPVDRLPVSLTHLEFGWMFNQPVNHLPTSLTHLTFRDHFNQRVDHLPASLTHLTLGSRFNNPVDYLPASLTHLTLGYYFNHPMDHLPASLTHLTLSYVFSQPVRHLPGSLKSIIIQKESQKSLFAPVYHHLLILE